MIGWALPTHADTLTDAKAFLKTAYEKINNAEAIKVVSSEDVTAIDDGDTYRTIEDASFQLTGQQSVVWGEVSNTEYSNTDGVQETVTTETRVHASKAGVLVRILSVNSTALDGPMIEKAFSKVKNKWIEVFSKKDVRELEEIGSLFAESAFQDVDVTTFTQVTDISNTCGATCTKKYSLKGEAFVDDIIAYLEENTADITDKDQDLLNTDDLETFTTIKEMGVVSMPITIEVSQKGSDYFVSTYVTIVLNDVEEIDSITVNTSEHLSSISKKVKTQKKPKKQLSLGQFFDKIKTGTIEAYGSSVK